MIALAWCGYTGYNSRVAFSSIRPRITVLPGPGSSEQSLHRTSRVQGSEKQGGPYHPRSEPDGHPKASKMSARQQRVVATGCKSKADGQMAESQQPRDQGRADRKRRPGHQQQHRQVAGTEAAAGRASAAFCLASP